MGWTWSLGFPINKKIWTSSYVLYTVGLGILTIGTMIWYIEVQGVRNWVTKFFDVFGKNPLFIYVLSAVLIRFVGLFRIPNGVNADGIQQYTTAFSWYYNNVCSALPGPPELGSLFYAITYMLLMWSVGYVLDKKGIYVKV